MMLIKLSERTGLTDVQSVYKLQGLYLQCLYVYMKYTRPGIYQCLSLRTSNADDSAAGI